VKILKIVGIVILGFWMIWVSWQLELVRGLMTCVAIPAACAGKTGIDQYMSKSK
jgi:hypothetical protein